MQLTDDRCDGVIETLDGRTISELFAANEAVPNSQTNRWQLSEDTPSDSNEQQVIYANLGRLQEDLHVHYIQFLAKLMNV